MRGWSRSIDRLHVSRVFDFFGWGLIWERIGVILSGRGNGIKDMATGMAQLITIGTKTGHGKVHWNNKEEEFKPTGTMIVPPFFLCAAILNFTSLWQASIRGSLFHRSRTGVGWSLLNYHVHGPFLEMDLYR